MLNIFFGDITGGRLKRLPYLGYSLLVFLLLIGFVFAVILAIGIGEHLIGGDLQQAQAKLREWFTLPFLIIFGLVMVLVLFVSANLKAKRLRDIGLPGWWSVLVIVVLTGVVSAAVSNQSSNGLYWLIWLALVLIPSNTFGEGQSPAG